MNVWNKWALAIGSALACVAVGALPLLLPFWVLVGAIAAGALSLCGLLSVRISACILVALAFFVQPDTTGGKGLRLVFMTSEIETARTYLFPVFFFIPAAFILFPRLGTMMGKGAAERSGVTPLLPGVAILGYAAISLLWTAYPAMSSIWLLFLFIDVLAFIFLVHACSDPALLKSVLRFLVVVGTGYSVIVIVYYFLEPHNYHWPFVENTEIFAVVGGGALTPLSIESQICFKTFILPPHIQGTVLNGLLAIIAGLLLVEPSRGKRWFLWGCLALNAYVTVFADNRGPFFALIAMIVFLVLSLDRLRTHWLRNGSVIAVALLLLIVVAHNIASILTGAQSQPRVLLGIHVPVVHFQEAEKEEGYGGSELGVVPVSRRAIWENALRSGVDALGFGIGPRGEMNLPEEPGTYIYAHSLYLDLFRQYGVFGLAVLGWMLVRMLSAYRRVARAFPSDARTLCIALNGALVATFVHGMAFHAFDDPCLWCLWGLAEGSSVAATHDST
ncbi:MAG: O-antigen ligase family protein [Lentisphaerae bacterium]|nr:O-antigen ligase family protein [Lentisphaerota bacterium]